MKMKFGLLSTLVVVLLCGYSYAQPGGPSGERPKIGQLSGQVYEPASDKPISYAKVFLLNVRDSAVVTGGLADSLGNFYIEEIPVGAYIAKITSFGFAPLFIDSLLFMPQSPVIQLGKLAMKTDNQLNTVDVVFEKQEVVAQIDRKVFNMDKQLT